MEHFVKYYSYNQVIEEHDVLIMTQEQFLQNKDQLDNPQVIVAVKRAGKPKEPKMPQWFKLWNEQVYEKRQPQWFKLWNEQVYEKKQPKWFEAWCENEFKPLVKRIDKIEDILERNNLH